MTPSVYDRLLLTGLLLLAMCIGLVSNRVSSGVTAHTPAQGNGWVELGPAAPNGNFADGMASADGYVLLGRTVNGALWRGSTNDKGEVNWETLSASGAAAAALDMRQPSIIYVAENQPGEFNTARLSIRKSADNGRRFVKAQFGLSALVPPNSLAGALALDLNYPGHVLAGGYQLARSENGGANWRPLNGIALGAPINALAIAPSDSQRVLIGQQNGYLTALNAVWEHGLKPTGLSGRMRNAPVTSVVFDPGNARIAYATYAAPSGARVWRGIEGIVNWASIDGTGAGALPDAPVYCLAPDPNDSQRLFVGTERGLFVTTDGGQNWTVDADFPALPVSALQFNIEGTAARLYAFTRGRGVWRKTLPGAACQFALETTQQNFAGAGGAGSVRLRANQVGCHWQAYSNAAWLRLDSPESGAGDTLVRFTIAPNRTPLKRNGVLTVGRHSFNVTQPPVEDTTPPTLTILEPTANPLLKTAETVVSLRLNLADDISVRRLTILNEAMGAPQSTEDPPNELVRIVPLVVGPNRLQLRAADAAGNVTTTTLLVFKRPALLQTVLAGNGLVPAKPGVPALQATFFSIEDVVLDAAGRVYFTAGQSVWRVNADGKLAFVLGVDPYCNCTSEARPDIQLVQPMGLAFDPSGNLYVSDNWTHSVYRVTPANVASRWAGVGYSGYGGDNGPAANAVFNTPRDLACDGLGNLYVADAGNHRVRKISPAGIITTAAGNGAANLVVENGTANLTSVIAPQKVACDASGNLYIVTGYGYRRVGLNGLIRTVAGGAFGETIEGSFALDARFRLPISMHIDLAGRLYLGDRHLGSIYRLDSDNRVRTWFQSVNPTGMTSDAADNLIFTVNASNYDSRVIRLSPMPAADAMPPAIAITTPQTLAPVYQHFAPPYPPGDPTGLTITGTATDDLALSHIVVSDERGWLGLAEGTAYWRFKVPRLNAGLNRFTFTAFDLFGNQRSLPFTVNYVATASYGGVVGQFGAAGYNGETQPATRVQLNSPTGLAFAPGGELYFADTGNHRLRKLTAQGTVVTVVGSGEVGFSADGVPALAAALNEPRALAFDAHGNLYFSDTANHRLCRLTPAGTIVTVAGTGAPGFSGDGGAATAAQLNEPTGLAFDATGNLYFSDTANQRLRRVAASTGIIETVAGTGLGDDRLNAPGALAFDRRGNLYIADKLNRRVRRLTPTGQLSTYAGGGTTRNNGMPATQTYLGEPVGLACDAQGNLFIAEDQTRLVAKVQPNGALFTFNWPAETAPEVGEPTLPLTTALLPPTSIGGLALGPSQQLYLSEPANQRLTRLTLRTEASLTAVSAASFSADVFAPLTITAAFGANLANTTSSAPSLPLPDTLAGTSVIVRDSQNRELRAALLFVSPTQINFVLPAGLANGPARLMAVNGAGEVYSSSIEIAPLAPALFSANGSGRGLAAAVALRLKADGTQQYEPIAHYNTALLRFVANPLTLDAPGEQVFLVLYGTGLQAAASSRAVGVQVGPENLRSSFMGAQGSLTGLDQINVLLPSRLAGRGEVDVWLVEGRGSNAVRIQIK